MSEQPAKRNWGLYVVGGVMAALGIGYLVDCRVARGFQTECWMTGRDMVTTGLSLAVGYAVGFNTPNPRIDADRRRQLLEELHVRETVEQNPPPPPPDPPGPGKLPRHPVL
jgi:hypothetical protein